MSYNHEFESAIALRNRNPPDLAAFADEVRAARERVRANDLQDLELLRQLVAAMDRERAAEADWAKRAAAVRITESEDCRRYEQAKEEKRMQAELAEEQKRIWERAKAREQEMLDSLQSVWNAKMCRPDLEVDGTLERGDLASFPFSGDRVYLCRYDDLKKCGEPGRSHAITVDVAKVCVLELQGEEVQDERVGEHLAHDGLVGDVEHRFEDGFDGVDFLVGHGCPKFHGFVEKVPVLFHELAIGLDGLHCFNVFFRWCFFNPCRKMDEVVVNSRMLTYLVVSGALINTAVLGWGVHQVVQVLGTQTERVRTYLMVSGAVSNVLVMGWCANQLSRALNQSKI